MTDITPSQADVPAKRPMGRPSLYRPEYCSQVIELGKLGYSEVQISAELDVPRTTMRSWAEKHHEFSSALARAKELEQAFWEHMGMDNIKERQFQSSVWAKSMQARFRHDYTERREVEQTTQVVDNTGENSDIRKVARAILAIMERAELEDLPPVIDAQAEDKDEDS
jgi:hypothetical protein